MEVSLASKTRKMKIKGKMKMCDLSKRTNHKQCDNGERERIDLKASAVAVRWKLKLIKQ